MKSYLSLLTVILIWSVSLIISKLAADSIGAAEIAFFRWLIAALFLTPFVLPSIWRKRANIVPLLPKLIVLGLFGMVIYQTISYYAAHMTSATHMGLIGALAPLMVIALSIIMLGQRLNKGMVMGSVLAVAGVALIVSSGKPSNLLIQGVNGGDALMLIATLSYAFYSILLKRWVMPSLTTVQLLYLQILVAVVAQFPLYLLSPRVGLNTENLPLVIYVGVITSIVAPLMWMKAVAAIGPSRCVMFFNLVPIFTAVIAFIWLHESLASYHLMGGALTIGGLLLAERWNQPLFAPRESTT